MCSPETASIVVIVVMALSGCCGVFVWISCLLGCSYLLYKYYKSRKHRQTRQKSQRPRDQYLNDGADSNGHQNLPSVATAVLQPMTAYIPVYYSNQATLMTHSIQPAAGGSCVPSVDETNSTLYRNRTIQQNISSHSLQLNPLYCGDDESSSTSYAYGHATHLHHHTSTVSSGHVISNNHQLDNINESDTVNSPPPDYDSLLQEDTN